MVHRFFSVSLLGALLLLSGQGYAQLSAYDSMYFPTTQSLDGSRSAPHFYSIVKVGFGQRAQEAMFFTSFKRAYSEIPLNTLLDAKIVGSVNTEIYMPSQYHQDDLINNLNAKTNPMFKSALMNMKVPTMVELDRVNEYSFDFRQGNMNAMSFAISIAQQPEMVLDSHIY